MSFLGKVAIVTGGSSGIGAAVAIRLSAERAKVAIVGRDLNKLKNVSDKCQKIGSKPLTIIADVTNEEDIKKIVSDTLKNYGKIDFLINSVGMIQCTDILSNNAMQVFDNIMATNLRSIVYLTNLIGPHLAKTKGNVVNLSSICGIRPFKTAGFAYNVSKGALDQFTRCVASELGHRGIRVNCVNPGPVSTVIHKEFYNSNFTEEDILEERKKSTLLKRISETKEIVDMIMFLTSDKARSITGASFVVDNGKLVRN